MAELLRSGLNNHHLLSVCCFRLFLFLSRLAVWQWRRWRRRRRGQKIDRFARVRSNEKLAIRSCSVAGSDNGASSKQTSRFLFHFFNFFHKYLLFARTLNTTTTRLDSTQLGHMRCYCGRCLTTWDQLDGYWTQFGTICCRCCCWSSSSTSKSSWSWSSSSLLLLLLLSSSFTSLFGHDQKFGVDIQHAQFKFSMETRLQRKLFASVFFER